MEEITRFSSVIGLAKISKPAWYVPLLVNALNKAKEVTAKVTPTIIGKCRRSDKNIDPNFTPPSSSEDGNFTNLSAENRLIELSCEDV
jgi:hypothetical protein